MVDMTFKPEMRGLLAKMKGKTFKSFECRYFDWWGYIVSPLRINLGSFALGIQCRHEEVGGWQELDEYDFPTCFICEEMSLDEPFLPKSKEIEEFLIGEKITGVEIVNDLIEFDGEPRGSIDQALVVRTKHNVYTFSRGIWFDTIMLFNKGEDMEMRYTVEKCADDWAEGPEGQETPANVIRTVIAL